MLDSATTSQYPSRVVLTSILCYPVGVEPIPLHWGHPDPLRRGPVIASRHPASIRIRNSIGAYGGSYCVYKALAGAIGVVDPLFRPDFTNTQPPFSLPPQPSWSDPDKIVSLDPYGHLVPTIFKEHLDAGVDVRPTIAITKAHMKLAEIDDLVRKGELEVDGKIVMPAPKQWSAEWSEGKESFDGSSNGEVTMKTREGFHEDGVELNVGKAAVEPVWYLPGVAKRFGISEALLRRALFEDTGGMYPELISRPDLKLFLPPIGGLTVYIFGNPAFVSDETKELTLRVHDECNGSDVFGSDICTCKPYLVYGISEAVKCAQRGGSGVVIYFRKEGRALGEVTKYLVYNARKRGGDSAEHYFLRTENIAGVKDMRFQALMPDVLHWLGIKKIDRMMSMSDMKHDAIVQSGIPILSRHEIPDSMIPPDSRVEIDAKIHAGYWSKNKIDDLSKTLTDLGPVIHVARTRELCEV
ncbi:hypothetical protein BT69DRAFT_1312210 [Atractiella rhizophila]|nr:hypothetical protein BT69DRAFT_1312210 [Atractiella rhizophila]